MLTTKERPAIERAIKRLVKAEKDASWIGSQPPSDQLAIKEELVAAKDAMKRALDRVTETS